jgi:hypothetical protein
MSGIRNYLNTFKWHKPRLLTYDKFSFFSPNIIFFPINLILIILTIIFNYLYKFFLVKLNYKFIYFLNLIKNRNCLKNFKTISQECYILGNGPSLKLNDLKFLKKKTTFVVNNFQETKNFIPTYHIILDGNFFSKWKNFLKKKIKSKKKTIFFFPSTEKKKFESLKSKIIFFDLLPYPIEEYLPSKICFKSGLPWAFNVIPFAILLAISLGFKKINIIGVNQTQLINGEHYISKKKYFKGVSLKGVIPDKTPRYSFGPRSNMLTMWSNYRIYLAYEAIENYAKKNKVRIYNLSEEGYLDTFKHEKLKKN